MKYLWIALLWAGYCWLHSFLICIRFTNLMTRLLKQYYAFYRLFYVAVSIALFIPLLRVTDGLQDPVSVVIPDALNPVRTALTAGCLLLFFWAFFVDYDALSFFGFRQIMRLFAPKRESGPGELKKSGLLGITRHPMYFALTVYLWCQTRSRVDILVNVVLTIYIVVGTRLEENKLVREFGEAYVRYQKEVPMLVPFIRFGSKPAPLAGHAATVKSAETPTAA
jgi:methanethiol S-methyltransferase